MTYTHTHTYTHGRSPLDDGLVSRRDFYQTTHCIHNKQAPRRPAGFEPTIPETELPQTHALYSAATGIDRTLIVRSCGVQE